MVLKEEEPDELNSLTESTEASNKESSVEIHSTTGSSMNSLKDVADMPAETSGTSKDEEGMERRSPPPPPSSIMVSLEATRSQGSPSSPIPVPHSESSEKNADEGAATSTPTSTQSR